MASKKTAFAVGLFMIIGLVIAITAIVWLGMSNYFEKGRNYSAYFDESVQGLDRDSPVKYRGVAIGRVKNVRLAPDGTLIEVLVSIEEDAKVEADMYAQLKSVGITGIMFIEIDRKKKDEIIHFPPINFHTDNPVIPTKPSGIKMFMDGMDDVLGLIHQLDTKGLSEKLKITLDTASRAIENINAITLNANRAVTRLDRIIAKNEEGFNESISALRASVKNADAFLKEGTSLMANSETSMIALRRHLIATLQNLEKASGNLNNFAELISDRPSQLIFGEPIPQKKFEPYKYDK